MANDEQELANQVFEAWMRRFDPAAYDSARGFGVSEWAEVLCWRRRLVDIKELGSNIDEIKAARDLLDRPLACNPDKKIFRPAVEDLSCYAAWSMKEVIERVPEVAKACESESNGPPPFESQHERDSEAWWDELFESFRQQEKDDAESGQNDLLFGSYNTLLADKFYEDSTFVEVDLAAPDVVIIEDFKSWLSEIRKDKRFEHSPVGRFSEKELARWVTNRVLPYIDLTLMARALGVTLTHHAAGSLIFPMRDFDPAEKIRKTVAPMAQELLSYSMLEALKRAANAINRKNRAK